MTRPDWPSRIVSARPDSSPSPMLSRLSETLWNFPLMLQCIAASSATAAVHNTPPRDAPCAPGINTAVEVDAIESAAATHNAGPLADGSSAEICRVMRLGIPVVFMERPGEAAMILHAAASGMPHRARDCESG